MSPLAGWRLATARFVKNDNFDLYVLAILALVATVLGAFGVVGVETLSSFVLALLAVLAISQIRTRRDIARIDERSATTSGVIFARDFPADLIPRRAGASNLLYIGRTMSRTVISSGPGLRQILSKGGTIRVLILDPTRPDLLPFSNPYSENMLQRILQSIDELLLLAKGTTGSLEIRVANCSLSMSLNAVDLGTPDGCLYVQHYEHRPPDEAAPIFRLVVEDGYWYNHYVAEAERLWSDGTPWPLSNRQALSRLSRPVFLDDFGGQLVEALGSGRDLFITGITRNTMLTAYYNRFEAWLRDGHTIRVMLLNPGSAAIDVVAERYYAERSSVSTRNRIEQSLRLLDQLRATTGGDLQVRLSTYPFAMGLAGVDSGATRTDASALFLEYYTYQAPGEPKVVLCPEDIPWFDHFIAEAEALWCSAVDYSLDA